MLSERHQSSTIPALLKAAFHQFAAGAVPAMLRHMLQVIQQLAGQRFLLSALNPHLGQTLVWRQLTGHTAQVLALHAGGNTFRRECIGPQGGNGKIWSLSQTQHDIEHTRLYSGFAIQKVIKTTTMCDEPYHGAPIIDSSAKRGSDNKHESKTFFFDYD